jgi:hypothetical protein
VDASRSVTTHRFLPRTVEDRLEASMRLGDSNSAQALARTLVGVLIDRLLVLLERRGRTIRGVVLSAQLVERGTWQETIVFRQAISDQTRMRLALLPKLALLPAPAESLSLAVQALGPSGGDQTCLFDGNRPNAPNGCKMPSLRFGRSPVLTL